MSKWRPTSGDCLYVIADVHGKYDQLKLIFNRIMPLRKSDGIKDRLIMLGDYVDRDVDTHKVIDLLIKAKKKYKDRLILLRGNHEIMLLDAIDSCKGEGTTSGDYLFWMEHGGTHTLSGYLDRLGIPMDNPYHMSRMRLPSIIPQEHVDFLRNELVSGHETEDFIFAHAGYDPTMEAHEQLADEVFWGLHGLYKQASRNAALKQKASWDKTIVIGHFRHGPFITNKFMMLDCSNRKELIVVEMHSGEAFVARHNKDRLVKIDLGDYVK